MSQFSDATALQPDGPGRFRADVHPDWSIAGRTNGGYLLSLLARAATEHAAAEGAATPVPVAAAATYLSPAPPGPASVVVDTLRAGRTTGAYRVRLEAAGEPRVEATVTLGRLSPDAEPFHDAVPQVQLPPAEQCVLLTRKGPGFDVPIMQVVHERLDPACLGWATGSPSGGGELRGHVELADGAPVDPLALLLLVDALPPATFDLGLGGWVPTLQLTAFVRALPSPGPLVVRQLARLVEDGLVDETCDVWDARGRLVATGHQLAGVRMR
ncbi:thioesterase family protein [Angustibacter aerolatus]